MIKHDAKRVTVFIQSAISDDLIIVAVYGRFADEVREQAAIAYAESQGADPADIGSAQAFFDETAVIRGITTGQPFAVWDCNGVDLATLDVCGPVTVFVDQPFRDVCDPYVPLLNVPCADAIPAALVEEYRTHTGDELRNYKIVGVMAGHGELRWCTWSPDMTDEVIQEVIDVSPSYAELSA